MLLLLFFVLFLMLDIGVPSVMECWILVCPVLWNAGYWCAQCYGMLDIGVPSVMECWILVCPVSWNAGIGVPSVMEVFVSKTPYS